MYMYMYMYMLIPSLVQVNNIIKIHHIKLDHEAFTFLFFMLYIRQQNRNILARLIKAKNSFVQEFGRV